MMKPFLRVVFAAFVCTQAVAEPTSPPVRAEIDALLIRLRDSGCQFSRNGDWYSGAEAREHLLRKLAYIEDRGALQSAEQFIDLVASQSSGSGRAYQVRCAETPPEESRAWLLRQLSTDRARRGEKGKP